MLESTSQAKKSVTPKPPSPARQERDTTPKHPKDKTVEELKGEIDVSW